MAPAEAQPKSFGFIFGMASGHINPSFPIARSLVERGHKVHYLVREQMREPVEGTGATWHSEVDQKPELFEGREPDVWGATESLKKELGIETETIVHVWTKLMHPQMELALPGVLRWLQSIRADVVVGCPLINMEAFWAAKVLGIPSVALFTTAGPGSGEAFWGGLLEKYGMTVADLCTVYDTFEPHKEAVARMNRKYGLDISSRPNTEPLGMVDVLKFSFVTIITTCEALQDPMSPELGEAYRRDGVRFEFTGPLLDKEGACRAGAHKLADDAPGEREAAAARSAEVLARIRAARAKGRKVVLVSMGTVITGDSPDCGWDARMPGADGVRRGFTGRELCQGAWGGAFDALGTEHKEEGPLLVVAVGVQPDPLGDLVAPANAVWEPVVPQVDILKMGVHLFLTHGGQNSFTESLAHEVPVVVCPGFGDQPVNGRKAEAMGVGLPVPRPEPEMVDVPAALAQYRRDVAESMRRVFTEETFHAKAAECGEQLRNAGGVPRATELVLAAAAAVPAKGEELHSGKVLSAFAGA